MAGFAVAITGGVASGKSAVADLFAARGVVLVDADLAARDIVVPGQPALSAIVERFGARALAPDGNLDRAWLRTVVFGDEAARRDLEAITHPRIRARLVEQAGAAPGPYVVVAIPLLAEGGGREAYPWLRRIVVVDAPEAVQRARLVVRDGIDAALADRMIAAQAPRARRLRIASDVIVNDAGREPLGPIVERLDVVFRRLATGAA